MKITLLAIGKVKGAYGELVAEYVKRLTAPFTIREFQTSSQKVECASLMSAIPPKAYVVLLDEHGKDLTSREFSDKMASWQERAGGDIVFIIGGADGVTQDIKDRANFTLGLGRKTWPHKMVRVMLVEQLYRAQQINSGHPYHRD